MPTSRYARLQGALPALILALLLAMLWGWFVPPFLATLQPAALYPPKILAFALFRPEAAMKSFLVAHYVLLIGGFLLFVRRQGVGGLGALAGGAFLAFNSSVLMGDHHPFRIASLAWLPLMFWLADRIAGTPRRAGIAALAVAVALQLLVGYPEFTLHAALLLGVQAIAMSAIGAWPTPPWRVLPRLAVAFGLGALLAGLQLAPFVELVVESQRSVAAEAWVQQQTAAQNGPVAWPQLVSLACGCPAVWASSGSPRSHGDAACRRSRARFRSV